MLNELLIAISSGLGICTIALALFKRPAQITLNEAKVLWVLHRKTAHCEGHKWQPLKRQKDKIIGFRCGCGFQYVQKRPLLCGSLKREAGWTEQPPLSLFDL
jgi:hypothetical protein